MDDMLCFAKNTASCRCFTEKVKPIWGLLGEKSHHKGTVSICTDPSITLGFVFSWTEVQTHLNPSCHWGGVIFALDIPINVSHRIPPTISTKLSCSTVWAVMRKEKSQVEPSAKEKIHCLLATQEQSSSLPWHIRQYTWQTCLEQSVM